MSWDVEAFRQRVEQQHTFPGVYVFKFIVPQSKEAELKRLLPKGELSVRASTKGNYVSVTLQGHMADSQAVLNVYLAVHRIEGCIAL